MFWSKKFAREMLTVAFLGIGLGGVGVVWGAEPPKKGDQVVADREAPIVRGQETLMLPTYRIAPPDVVQIEMQKMVPNPPYRVGLYDVLQIRASGTLVDQPIDGFYLVQAEGTVDLGPAYGSVRLAGMTIDEAKEAVQKKLVEILKQPEASVQLSRTAGTQTVTGEYLVGPDGTINLRQYGTIPIAGKTLAEARQAVEKQLRKFFASPEVSVDVLGYNSHVYYVITEGPMLGFKVTRVPCTGNETILDALSQLPTLPHLPARKLWIARPGSGTEKVLPVDWEAITRQGSSATNHQLLPGDRLMIVEEVLPTEPPAVSLP